ncbi:sulfurtransferase TusA family protein [Fictibacillus nanhaiensis]|uniref:sulfurtransferase TusA family protein n=1 Tax=Fictibacillus nanhaiensis TaxID=742169 RepID=UPI001C93B2DE|nr:sulfurtransferase TusA family protein [Fictibacillus nanhaiensis]MBY6038079.1 sulfurtransferase TusA family protein [Fictibacillus nanhaiensis]
MSIKVDQVLDCKGLFCPMPIVRTKKAMDQLEAGQVIEVLATDKGSLADIQGWARNTGNQYLGTKEDGDVLIHYLRKANPDEVKEATKFEHTIQNDELEKALDSKNDDMVILDVREPAEYAFKRIPGAVSIPLGDLENKLSTLDKNKEIHVVCRTGNRSDMAAQILTANGFEKVKNVLPGMSEWTGPTENDEGGNK